MIILAADTSSERSTLALYKNGEMFEVGARLRTPSAASFFVLLDALLTTARVPLDKVTCLAIGAGPGSFTGLRVSFAAFRSLAWARSLPLYPVPSLIALAYPYRALEATLVARTPARRGHVYQCALRGGVCIDELAFLSDAEARRRTEVLPSPRFLLGVPEAGEEAPELPLLVRASGPAAASIAEIACGLAADGFASAPKLEDVLPLYLRPSDAELSLSKKT